MNLLKYAHKNNCPWNNIIIDKIVIIRTYILLECL